MKKLVFFGIFCCAFILGAAEVFFSGGVVVEAKLSEKMPQISRFEAAYFPELPERKIYAMLSLDVPAPRKISIFDYQLEIFGRDYPCVALREEQGAWTTTAEIFPGGKRYSLLFILNAGMVGMKDTEIIALKNGASQEKTSVSFQNLRETAF